MDVDVVGDRSHPTLTFAAEEIARFAGPASAGYAVRLQLEAGLREGIAMWRVEGGTLVVSGGSPRDVLLGVYSVLEQAGVFFDIARGGIGLADFSRVPRQGTVQPAVTARGIRQHINFPMDISSYPLEQALEYIRNVARLRFNHMTFHSYPQQWYVCPLRDRPPAAGRFFYDMALPVPDHPVMRGAVRNQREFSIPEIEPRFDDRAARSDAAIAWLQRVLSECKRCGMTVQFSIEPREASANEAVGICRHVAAIYPQIDTLEIITQECGMSWGKSAVTRAELAGLIDKHFGPGASDLPGVRENLADGLGQLVAEARELALAIEVIERLQRERFGPRLALGIYASDHATLRILLALMRRFAPDLPWAFLPAHAARAAADSVRAMALAPNDLVHTMLYSWIEFDGLMYLQQNGVTGIHQLLAHLREVLAGSPITGIAFNHWRTAENRLAARYAAEACVSGPIEPAEFTRRFAERLAIADTTTFARAMQTLDDVDTQARNELPNVGFCWEGCWKGDGLGTSGRYRAPVIADVTAKYAAARESLLVCLAGTTLAEGKDFLAFLINRVECSILHLRAILRLAELQTIYRASGMSQTDMAFGRRLCDEALAWAEEYMAHHARHIADRGCEGTLISYYHVIPKTIRRLRTLFGTGDVPAVSAGVADPASPAPTADAPPPPAIG